MTNRYFRVLVIDDSDEVIDKLPDRVKDEKRVFEGRSWRVDFRPVHVKVERSPDRLLRFTAHTFRGVPASRQTRGRRQVSSLWRTASVCGRAWWC
jgi:hypothetical protein